jgi:putative ABC transport system permease protein
MRSWRAALRIARRELRRAKGRAVMVIAMIAIPVAALAFAAVSYDTFRLSPGEQADRAMGTAQAAVRWPQDTAVHQTVDGHTFYPANPQRQESAQPGPAPAGPTVDRMLALMPAGSRAIPEQNGYLTVRTAAGVAAIRSRMLDYADPLAHGILRQVSGRAPSTVDEVALTQAAATRLGTGIGGPVRLPDGRAFRTVGIIEDPQDLAAMLIVLRPGAVPATELSAGRQDLTWLVATPGPVTWEHVRQLNTHGLAVTSRYVLAHPPGPGEQYPDGPTSTSDALQFGVLVGVLAILEIILLAGPAFAVSTRRRRRDLALVAAAGGTPAHLRRIVLADGVVLGSLAAAAGLVFGVLAAVAGRPLLEQYVAHVRSGGLRLFPTALATLAGVAIVTGTVAALVPAMIASRQDVVAALTGRRGITRSRRRWVVVGIVLAAIGVATSGAGAVRTDSTLIVIGIVLGELGLVLCTPAIVGLVARLGQFLPVAPRIALRDTARNRTAAAPAISAVLAAVVGSLAGALVVNARDQQIRDDYQPAGRVGAVVVWATDPGSNKGPAGQVPAGAVAAVRGAIPVDRITDVAVPTCEPHGCLVTPVPPAARACPYTFLVLGHEPSPAQQRAARRDSRCEGVRPINVYFGGFGTDTVMTFIVDPSEVGGVFDLAPGDAATVSSALRTGAVVVDDARYLQNGRVTLDIREGPSSAARQLTVAAAAMPHLLRTPIALMTDQTAHTLGLRRTPMVTVATTTRTPTVAEEDRLRADLGDGYFVYVERGGPSGLDPSLLVLAGVAAVIALVAAGIATGLAAADGRADLATLAAVGASPRVRRLLSLSRSGVIAGLGSLLGAAAGLGAAIAILVAVNRQSAGVWPAPTPYPIQVPWLNVGIAVLAVPLVAMLGAGLLTRSRLPIERRL